MASQVSEKVARTSHQNCVRGLHTRQHGFIQDISVLRLCHQVVLRSCICKVTAAKSPRAPSLCLLPLASSRLSKGTGGPWWGSMASVGEIYEKPGR